MMLFQWKAEGVDLFIMERSEDEARAKILKSLLAWRWQDSARIDSMLIAVKSAPYFIAGVGYTIVVDSRKK